MSAKKLVLDFQDCAEISARMRSPNDYLLKLFVIPKRRVLGDRSKVELSSALKAITGTTCN